RISIHGLVHIRTSEIPRQHFNIYFCKMHFQSKCGILKYAFFDILQWYATQVPGSLYSHCIDLHTCSLYFLYQADASCSLRGLLIVVIIIDEFRSRSGFIRKAKRLGYIIIAEHVKKDRLSHSAILIERLVHHIPGCNSPLVSSCNGSNMISEESLNRIRILHVAHKLAKLAVPDERVSIDGDV